MEDSFVRSVNLAHSLVARFTPEQDLFGRLKEIMVERGLARIVVLSGIGSLKEVTMRDLKDGIQRPVNLDKTIGKIRGLNVAGRTFLVCYVMKSRGIYTEVIIYDYLRRREIAVLRPPHEFVDAVVLPNLKEILYLDPARGALIHHSMTTGRELKTVPIGFTFRYSPQTEIIFHAEK